VRPGSRINFAEFINPHLYEVYDTVAPPLDIPVRTGNVYAHRDVEPQALFPANHIPERFKEAFEKWLAEHPELKDKLQEAW